MKKIMRLCELCNGEALLYCESDSAYLCFNCDSKVHEANFLVARHIRRTICSICYEFDGNFISGLRIKPVNKPICLSCSSSDSGNLDYLSSSSSSDCISTAESFNLSASTKSKKTKKKKINLNRKKIPMKITCSSSVSDISGEITSFPVKFSGNNSKFPAGEELSGKRRFNNLTKVDLNVKGILVNWCRKLGLKNSCTIIPLALHAFRVCLNRFKNLPFRVGIACSFWFALKFSGGKSTSTCQNLKRFEKICGVPVKLIVCIESKISRVFILNPRFVSSDDLQEGCDEC